MGPRRCWKKINKHSGCLLIVATCLLLSKHFFTPFQIEIVFAKDRQQEVIAAVEDNPPKQQEQGVLGNLLTNTGDRKINDSEDIAIGIGCAITTRGAQAERYIPKVDAPRVIADIVYFTTFLPSFCFTSSEKFTFQFVVSYDFDDPLLQDQDNVEEFERIFHRIVQEDCSKELVYSLTMLRCSYSKQPARAQNDAMMRLYLNNVDYLYRVNDDTTMRTQQWESMFIDALKAFDPPNIGVVGPETKARQHRKFLTYDFVHKTHVDIFGFYYPHLFVDWYADQWIDKVYRPSRSRKVRTVIHVHNFNVGQRYLEHIKDDQFKNFTVDIYKGTLSRYIASIAAKDEMIEIDGPEDKTSISNVISMCLWGSNPRYTNGAIRNAQLAPVVFPGWTLRFYIPPPDAKVPTYRIPLNIESKLLSLGAEVRYTKLTYKDSKHCKFLVTTESDIDAFIIRDPDMRLTDRDAKVVAEWMASNKTVHCIRDNPRELRAGEMLSHSLLGGKPNLFEQNTDSRLSSVIKRTLMNPNPFPYDTSTDGFWDVLKEQMLCHTYKSSRKDTEIKLLPSKRRCGEYIGQKFNATGHPLETYLMTRQCKKLFASAI